MISTFEQAGEIVDKLYMKHYKMAYYDQKWVEEYSDCWFIPSPVDENGYGIIGSMGVIIDKADGHINMLGSAFALDDWLWGHQRGFKHDTYDLVITKIHSFEKTLNFLSEISLRYPTVNSKRIAWYNQNQIKTELEKVRPTFSEQRLGLSIPLFREIENANLFEFQLIVRSCENEICSACSFTVNNESKAEENKSR